MTGLFVIKVKLQMNSIQIGKQTKLFLVISNTVCFNVRIVSIMDTDMNFQLRQQIFLVLEIIAQTMAESWQAI